MGGEAEEEADKVAIHVAITYDGDGTIQFYRNGKPYGKATNKGGLQVYKGNKSQVLFGMRHGEVGEDDEGKNLQGRIYEARLYDRALSGEEIMASASGGSFVSEGMLLEALSTDQREELTRLRKRLSRQEDELSKLPESHEPNEAWARLAHVIFNLKEFIYLK